MKPWLLAEECIALTSGEMTAIGSWRNWVLKMVKQDVTLKNLIGHKDKWYGPRKRVRWNLYHRSLVDLYVSKQWRPKKRGVEYKP